MADPGIKRSLGQVYTHAQANLPCLSRSGQHTAILFQPTHGLSGGMASWRQEPGHVPRVAGPWVRPWLEEGPRTHLRRRRQGTSPDPWRPQGRVLSTGDQRKKNERDRPERTRVLDGRIQCDLTKGYFGLFM